MTLVDNLTQMSAFKFYSADMTRDMAHHSD